jgi:hypothetical protein
MATELELLKATDVDVSPMDEVGASGLRRWAGQIDEEFVPDLKGDQGRRKYREMAENHAVAGAALLVIEQYVAQVPVRVECTATDATSLAALELVETSLDDTSTTWTDTISDILTDMTYGWSMLETVYKRRLGPDREDGAERSKYSDGRIGWRKFAFRSQLSLDRWEFDEEDGSMSAMTQRPAPNYDIRTIPIEKALLFRARSQGGNPEGVSLLRRAYKSYHYQEKIQFIEAVGIDRDATGVPLMYVPQELFTAAAGSAGATILAECKKIVTRVRQDEQGGMVLPQAYDSNSNPAFKFELVASPGSRSLDAGKVIERYDQRIAMAMLADFILLGHEQVGSFALADSKTSVFALAVAGWVDSILGVFNRYAIPRLLRINGLAPDELPRMVRGDVETPDLAAIGGYITALAGAGMPLFPDDDLEAYLREAANLPALADDAYPMQSEPEPRAPAPPTEADLDDEAIDGATTGEAAKGYRTLALPPISELGADDFPCPVCDASFEPINARQVYCSKRCGYTAQKRRQRAKTKVG